MYNSFNEAVNKLCKEFLKSQGYATYPVRIGGAFKTGAFSEISDRLESMTVERDAITSSSTGTSLVMFKSAAVNEFFGECNYAQTKLKQIQDETEYFAKVKGVAAGKTIEIAKAVE